MLGDTKLCFGLGIVTECVMLQLIFRGSWGSSVNWLEPKAKPQSANLACPNQRNPLYLSFYLGQIIL